MVVDQLGIYKTDAGRPLVMALRLVQPDGKFVRAQLGRGSREDFWLNSDFHLYANRSNELRLRSHKATKRSLEELQNGCGLR